MKKDLPHRLALTGLSAFALVCLAFLLKGCASVYEVHDDLKSKADFTLDAARVGFCDAPTLGALRREYAGDLHGMRKHLIACGWSFESVDVILNY